MIFRCATAVIHAAGFSGIPLSGQLERAEVNASCMASSAKSKEPESRIKVAMILPDSCRKIDSATALASAIPSARIHSERFSEIWPRRKLPNRADLDTGSPAATEDG